MCEMVDPYTTRSAQVDCSAAIKKYRENHNRDYEGQIEVSYPVENFLSTRGPI